jgi:hypothetical protein
MSLAMVALADTVIPFGLGVALAVPLYDEFIANTADARR